jgi:dihydrofolate reductase
MSTVLLYTSMSLDGYVAGPGVSDEHPMGEGGERLHEWMFADPLPESDQAMLDRIRAETGAVVVGRRTFDIGLPHWGDVPFPVPSFVVTHRPRSPLPQPSGTFTFVDGVAPAVDAARQHAGDGKVVLMGGEIYRQALRAGLVDELLICQVPVLLGGGVQLFDDSDTDTGRLELAPVEVVGSPAVTQLRYRVVR